MPKPRDSNPPQPTGRLMKQASAARYIGVHRQYIPVMIGRGELDAEDVDGVPYVTRASAERAKAARLAKHAESAKRFPRRAKATKRDANAA